MLKTFLRYKPSVQRIAVLLSIVSIALFFACLLLSALIGYEWINFGASEDGGFISGFWGYGGLSLGRQEWLVVRVLAVMSAASLGLAVVLGFLCALVPWPSEKWFTW